MNLLAGRHCIVVTAGGTCLEGNIAVTITCSPWYVVQVCAVLPAVYRFKYVTGVVTPLRILLTLTVDLIADTSRPRSMWGQVKSDGCRSPE